MALTTYQAQNDFARRHVKSGAITRSGTWRHHLAWGHLWSGRVDSYIVSFETIGDGPLMRPGSFRVRADTSQQRTQHAS